MSEVQVFRKQNEASKFKTDAIVFAICSKDLEMVECLVKDGADVDEVVSSMDTPLTAACDVGDLKIIEFLVENGADINLIDKYGHSPLTMACLAGKYDIVKYLIAKGADVNNNTPLLSAIKRIEKTEKEYLDDNHQNVHEQIVEYLLECGADPYLKGDHGLNAFELAEKMEKLKVMNKLEHYRKIPVA